MFWFKEIYKKEKYKVISVLLVLILLVLYIFHDHIIMFIISLLTAYGVLLTVKFLLKQITKSEESFNEIYFFIMALSGWCCVFLLSYELLDMVMTSMEAETNQTHSQQIIYIFSVIFALSIEELVMLEQKNNLLPQPPNQG